MQARGYAVRDNNMCFSPTPLGEALIGAYDRMGLKAVYECVLCRASCHAERQERPPARAPALPVHVYRTPR